MMWGWYGPGGFEHGAWLPGMIMGIVWLALIAAVIFILIRAFAQRPAYPGVAGPHLPQAKGDNALNILRERYARGEISPEEYQRIFTDLTHQP